jgi:hypothetical protein
LTGAHDVAVGSPTRGAHRARRGEDARSPARRAAGVNYAADGVVGEAGHGAQSHSRRTARLRAQRQPRPQTKEASSALRTPYSRPSSEPNGGQRRGAALFAHYSIHLLVIRIHLKKMSRTFLVALNLIVFLLFVVKHITKAMCTALGTFYSRRYTSKVWYWDSVALVERKRSGITPEQTTNFAPCCFGLVQRGRSGGRGTTGLPAVASPWRQRYPPLVHRSAIFRRSETTTS